MGTRLGALLIAIACSAPAAATPRDSTASALAAAIGKGHALLRRQATHVPGASALIAIVIDDLGEQRAPGLRALRLPGPVAMAFLPGGAHTTRQATLAHELGKEVLVHLPLEPGDGRKRHPAAITTATTRDELQAYFARALAAVPFARGVNNHQGSRLTEHAQAMEWLMEEFGTRPQLYFVDSRTSNASIAYRVALARGVPATERNVFLDNERGFEAVRKAFRALIAKARRNGRALAIGHPYPETLQVLEEELPNLARYGVRLVSPSEIIARQQGHRGPYRPLRLSPSLTLAARTTLPARPSATSATAH